VFDVQCRGYAVYKCGVVKHDECVFQGVILKITDEGRCIVGRILHGGMMHKLGTETQTSDISAMHFVDLIDSHSDCPSLTAK